MAMIQGIPVILYEKISSGEDGFGCPVYKYRTVIVENVLVAPSSTDDCITAENLFGKKSVYTLAVPKGDEHDWTDAVVEFFGYKWKTFGFPIEGIESNIPLDWNKKVMVERYG